jgi:endonuclease YncB( thermonuclease family)
MSASENTGWSRCPTCGAPVHALEKGCSRCGWERVLPAATITLLLFLLFLSFGLSAQTLSGPARVVDGDTLEVQGQRIRLHGVDAPELSQTCQRKGSPYHCGAVSLVRLKELIDGRPVTCQGLDRDRWERVIARCFVGQPHIDLGGWLVRNGLAVAYVKYSRDYLPQEAVARGARLGLWSGAFVPPAEWRKGVRDGR